MKFIFLLPGKQDKTVRNRGLYNSHCLLRGNKAVCKRRVLFSWHRIAPWALTQHVTGQRTMRREQEGQGRPFQGKSSTRPCAASALPPCSQSELTAPAEDPASPSGGPGLTLSLLSWQKCSFIPWETLPQLWASWSYIIRKLRPWDRMKTEGTPEGFRAPSALNGHLLLGRLCTLDARV